MNFLGVHFCHEEARMLAGLIGGPGLVYGFYRVRNWFLRRTLGGALSKPGTVSNPE